MGYTHPKREIFRLIAPATEPVSLSAAKIFLRIDQDDEDTLLSDLIEAARLAAESRLNKSLITQQWRVIYYGGLDSGRLSLPYGPVQAILSVNILQDNQTAVELSSEQYALDAFGLLQIRNAVHADRVQIDYRAGYGDAASDVPLDITQAILLHVASLYEHRDTMEPPQASLTYYHAYREVKL